MICCRKSSAVKLSDERVTTRRMTSSSCVSEKSRHSSAPKSCAWPLRQSHQLGTFANSSKATRHAHPSQLAIAASTKSVRK